MAFDLFTRKMNKKGQIVKDQPYNLYIDGGVQVYERDGEFFYADGSPAEKEHIPAAALKAVKARKDEAEQDVKMSKAQLKKQIASLNEALKAHGEDEGTDRTEIPELKDEDQAALDALIGDDKEQISATRPTSKTNAKAQK